MLKGRARNKHKNNEHYMNVNAITEANERKQREMNQDFKKRLSDIEIKKDKQDA